MKTIGIHVTARFLATTLFGLLLPRFVSAQAAERPEDAARAKSMIESAEEVAKQVAELRGVPFKRPVAKAVRTEAELREYIMKELFEEEFGGGKLARHQ